MTQSVDIESLLKNCVLKVMTRGDQGTGFVISKQLALTCAHVVESVGVGGSVEIKDFRGRIISATVQATFPPYEQRTRLRRTPWPDLALLNLADEGADIQAVLIDTQDIEPETRLLVGGYPAGTEIDYQTRAYTAGPVNNYDDSAHRYLSLSGGSIDPGLSGAPVLSPAGFVCGYVTLTKSSRTLLGGWVVPLSEVIQKVDALSRAYQNPGPAALTWARSLHAATLKVHGRRDQYGVRFDADEPMPTLIDLELLRVMGNSQIDEVSEWDVCITTQPGLTQRLRTADLGEGVLEAVDHWSRRHQLAGKKQVELLGRVLYRALMPPEILSAVDNFTYQEPPLVRLKTDDKNTLAAIPWEYAQLDQLGLATTPKWAFARYVTRSKPELHRAERARVLIVVNGAYEEPKDLSASLNESLLRFCKRIELHVVHTQSFNEFNKCLHEGPWDVVHYLGIGWSDGALGFTREWHRPNESSLMRVEWATVRDSISITDAKVIILQLGTQPSGLSAPIGTYLDILDRDGQVRALVLAEHTNSLDHIMIFNNPFYGFLEKGFSVERAVQEARKALKDTPPAAGTRDQVDYAAFGTVSVITTREGNIRLLSRDLSGDSGLASASRSVPHVTDTRRPLPLRIPDTSVPGVLSWKPGAHPSERAGFDR